MKSITDTTFYEIEDIWTYAPVSKKRIKQEKKYWKSKPPQEYYETMKTSILETIKNFGMMFQPITPKILDEIRYSVFAYPFEDGALCKKLRVIYNTDKQKVQIDWKFDGKHYEVYV